MSESAEREAEIVHDLLCQFERRLIAAGRNPVTLAKGMILFAGRLLESLSGVDDAAAWLNANAHLIRTDPKAVTIEGELH